jgi:hypothetical protein
MSQPRVTVFELFDAPHPFVVPVVTAARLFSFLHISLLPHAHTHTHVHSHKPHEGDFVETGRGLGVWKPRLRSVRVGTGVLAVQMVSWVLAGGYRQQNEAVEGRSILVERHPLLFLLCVC